MAEVYGPFDSGPGASFTEAEWSEMMRNIISDGVVPGFLNSLAVFADNTGMQVKVPTGAAFVQGLWYKNTAQKTLAIAAAHATLARWDLVILQLDWVNNTLLCVVKTGTPNASPSDPALTQNTSVWEFPLARVIVGAAVGILPQDKVQDVRAFSKNQNQPDGSIQNLLINGSLDNWQRGAGPFTISGSIGPDRWEIQPATGTVSVSRDTANVDIGSTYCAAITVASTPSCQFRQSLSEFLNALKGKTVTFSVRIKCSTQNAVRLAIWDNVNSFRYSSYHTGSGVYETLTVTAPVAAAATGLYVIIYLTLATTAYADNATLCIGSIPMNYYPLVDDFVRCLRYYQVWGGVNAAEFICPGQAWSTIRAQLSLLFQLPMGGVPTIAFSSAAHFSVYNATGSPVAATAISAPIITSKGCYIDVTVASGLVAGSGTILAANNISARLVAEWNP